MAGRPLKNYDLYMDKLKSYAAACDLTIEYGSVDGDGKYVPIHRKIVLDVDLPESTEVATLLHELGHTLDDTLYQKKEMNKLSKAYPAFYADKASPSQKELVIECERRAWVYARSIAKRLRIPLGKWFDKEEQEALTAYRTEQ